MKRSMFFYRLWTALVFLSSIFWWFWRWVPRVSRSPAFALAGSLVRSTETVCPLDPAVHDCNLELMGSCPADFTRSHVHGFVATLGPIVVAWPRSFDA